MSKKIFMLFLFIAYPARAQIGSGTIVVINISKNQVAVAADSRQLLGQNTATPNDSYCKIAAFGHQFIFTSVGINSFNSFRPDLIKSWDNIELARDAIQNVSGAKGADPRIDTIATNWANAVGTRWNSRYFLQPIPIKQEAEANNGQITSGIFIQAKGLLMRAVVISFNPANLLAPIEYQMGPALGSCWPCGQAQGAQICAGGHLDVVAKYCFDRKENTEIRTRTHLIGANAHTRLAVKIAELTIDTYERTTGDVGGKVDAVTLDNNGGITWNSRKANCPDNQD
jgi:hypothetical protein